MGLIKTPSASLRHPLACFPLRAGLTSELPVPLEPPVSAASPYLHLRLVSGPQESLNLFGTASITEDLCSWNVFSTLAPLFPFSPDHWIPWEGQRTSLEFPDPGCIAQYRD